MDGLIGDDHRAESFGPYTQQIARQDRARQNDGLIGAPRRLKFLDAQRSKQAIGDVAEVGCASRKVRIGLIAQNANPAQRGQTHRLARRVVLANLFDDLAAKF